MTSRIDRLCIASRQDEQRRYLCVSRVVHEALAKLLSSAAVEAFAEVQKDKKFEPVKNDAVKAVIEDADKAGRVEGRHRRAYNS